MRQKKTETEIAEMLQEATTGARNDPVVELEWLGTTEAGLLTREKQQNAHFRMQHFLRNEENMEAVLTDLREVRNALEYVRKRKAELMKEAKQNE